MEARRSYREVVRATRSINATDPLSSFCGFLLSQGRCRRERTGPQRQGIPQDDRRRPLAVDEAGQIIDVFVSRHRDVAAAEWFFARALRSHGEPGEIVTDKSPVLARVVADLVPDAEHCTEQYANNRVEADHGRLKARFEKP
jgi:hypothetical protein